MELSPFLVSTKNKIVFQLYRSPNVTNETSSVVLPYSKIWTPPGASFKTSSTYFLGYNECYCLILNTPLCPLRETSFAVWMLPNQASPLTPCLIPCMSSGVVPNSNLSVQPVVTPTCWLNFWVFIPSFSHCISIFLRTPVIGHADVLNSVS